MKLLIIGNGFDLSLGLPTKYGDFISSNEFDVLVNEDNKLAIHLKQIYENQRWVDIENELANYYPDVKEDFEDEYYKLCECLIKYLNTIDYESINRKSPAYSQIYLLKDMPNYKIINFNYTDSVRKILEELSVPKDIIDDKIVHIHGSLSENSIVFGVEDDSGIADENIFLKKAYNPSFKSVNVNKLLLEAREVVFFGHSLGSTDHSYFKTFFTLRGSGQNRQNTSMEFYYYGKAGYKQLFLELDDLTSNSLTGLRQTNNFILSDTSIER